MIKKNFGTILLAILFCILVLYIIIYPSEAFQAAYDGLLLWFNSVLPALLPFFICVEILIGLGIVSFLGSCFKFVMRPIFRIPGEGSFAFFMSIASGYPVGAKITATLLQNNICSTAEAQRMLSLCSTSGPLFIIGAVATGILGNPKMGLLLASAHYLSALTAGFLMRFWGNKNRRSRLPQISSEYPHARPLKEMLDYRKKDGRPFGLLLGDAVKNGINLILVVGGFIILFSVITRILKLSGILGMLSKGLCVLLPIPGLQPETVSSIIVGLMEMTNGIKECAALNLPLIYKLMITSFLIGFGGLSVNAQVLSVLGNVRLKFGLYSIMKIFQGMMASLYCLLLFGFVQAQQVFNVYDSTNVSLYVRYLNSGVLVKIKDSSFNLLLVLGLMLFFALAANLKELRTRP